MQMFVFGLASWLMPAHVVYGYLLDNSDRMQTRMMQVNKVRVKHTSQRQQVSINCSDPSGNTRKEKSKLID